MILSLAAYGGSGGWSNIGGSSGGTTPTASGARFIPGNYIEVATRTVDDKGGTITVTGTGTHLDGAQITFPAGALPSAMDISVGYYDGTIELPKGMATSSSPRTIAIRTNGTSKFSQPVKITVPYTDEQNIPVPFYVDDNGQLRPVVVTNIDEVNKTFTFITMHASIWIWIVPL